MPEPGHPYPDDAQDRRRSDEHADDDEQHVWRGRTCPTTCNRSVLILRFSVCAVVHIPELLASWRIGPPDREGGAAVAVGAVQCDTDTNAKA